MMMMAEISPLKNNKAHNTDSCIKEQQQQTIISKVLKQEISKMAQKAQAYAHQQTHMTLKKYFEFSNDAANTTSTKAEAAPSKRINKNMYAKQRTQNIDQQDSNKAFSTINPGKHEYQLKLRPTFANTTDPTDFIPNLATISSRPSSSAPSTSLLPPATARTADTEHATEFAVAGTIPVTGDIAENSQSKIQQCNNVCISLKFGSKLKCAQQQKQKQHCKSANISSSKNNFNNIRTCSKTNINTHITDGNVADAASTSTSPSTVEGITNTNIITTTSTTNKANIRFNTVSTTTITATATHTDNVAPTSDAAAATPTELSTAATTYCKAFPLRHHFYQNTKQLECLLRTVVFSFMFVMSMQYQTGK